MDLPIILIIDGCDPVSWKAHGGYGKRSFNPRHEERLYYQLQIKKQYQHNLPITTAVKIEYIFNMRMPIRISKKMREKMLTGVVKHVKRPDVTNLQKFTEDCLKGIVIKDDSQVVESIGKKFYADHPCTVIKICLA